MAKKVMKIAGVVAGIALIGTGIGAALGGTMVLSALGATVAASTIATVAGAVGAAASLFVKKPDVPRSHTERLHASIEPAAKFKTVLGSTAMPVDIRYSEWFGTDQERCGWIVALAAHRIDGVDQIWFNDELAWTATGGVTSKFNGYFWVRAIRNEGTANNTVTFGSGRWNASRRLTGCAYAWLEFKVTGNSKKTESPFSGGVPSRVTIIGRGAPLYDPRRDSTVPGGSGPMRANDQSTWRYTTDDSATIGENLALQILRVLIGGRINGKLATGCGLPLRRLNLASFAIAANQCDELVNRSAGGTEPRFRGAGVLSEEDDPSRLLDMLCAACCGRLTDVGGKLGLVISHNDLAEAATDDGLNDDDVIGAFTWDPDPSPEETPNVARGRYTDPSAASLYQMVPYPEVSLPQGEAGEVVLPLDLPVVESPSQAQRIAKQALQRAQYRRTFSAPFDIRAWKYQVGQVVPFTFAPLGFSRRLFRIIDQDPGSVGQCMMVLREENTAIYAWDADDRPPVQAAEPIVYDGRNNPLILAIDEAAETAVWENVTGEGRPQDNADVTGENTAKDTNAVGGVPADQVNAAVAAAKALAESAKDRQDTLEGVTIPAVNAAVADANDRITAARAALEQEDTILHQRITSLSVEGGGYDDSALWAQVQEVHNAALFRDEVLAERQSAVEAKSSSVGFLNPNPRFTVWPDGEVMPTGWVYNTGPLPSKIPLPEGAHVVSTIGPAGTDSYFSYQNRDARPPLQPNGYYVIEAEVMLTAGTLQGAGVLFREYYSDAATFVDRGLHFATDAGNDTGAPLGDGPLNRRVKFSKLVKVGTDATWFDLFLIAHRATFAPIPAANALEWFLCGVRAANAQEIAAGVAIPDLQARVETVETALTDGTYATAQALTEVAATAGNAAANASAALTAVTDGLSSVTNSIETLESEVGDAKASLTEQAATLVEIDGRTYVYWGVTGTTGDGRTMLALSKADGSPGLFYVDADMLLTGSVRILGIVTASAFVQNQGVDYAALVPGTLNWRVSTSNPTDISGNPFDTGIVPISGSGQVTPGTRVVAGLSWNVVNNIVYADQDNNGIPEQLNPYFRMAAYYRINGGPWTEFAVKMIGYEQYDPISSSLVGTMEFAWRMQGSHAHSGSLATVLDRAFFAEVTNWK